MAYTSAAAQQVLTATLIRHSEFGLKVPIHAPLWVVFGGFDPLDEAQYQPISQKFHLLVIAVPAVYYLCGCL